VRVAHVPPDAGLVIGLVGKGVMYDSGGISLKPTDASHVKMKMDMAGAAVAAAVALYMDTAMENRIGVAAYLPCVENMPSGSAMRLGDVVTCRDGTTVEIQNCDAEGRLILADALALAREDRVDVLIDLATLTDAASIAIGPDFAAMMCSDDDLAADLLRSATKTGELLCRLPIHRPYERLLRSAIADVRNVGGPAGRVVTAGLFLERFAHPVPWAHIDMTSTMASDEDADIHRIGATGYGVRLVLDLIANMAARVGPSDRTSFRRSTWPVTAPSE